ncbi:hypothetical protein PAMP_022135 [Pampus punctatissimus]
MLSVMQLELAFCFIRDTAKKGKSVQSCQLQTEMTRVWHTGHTDIQQCEHQNAALLLYSQGQLV